MQRFKTSEDLADLQETKAKKAYEELKKQKLIIQKEYQKELDYLI